MVKSHDDDVDGAYWGIPQHTWHQNIRVSVDHGRYIPQREPTYTMSSLGPLDSPEEWDAPHTWETLPTIIKEKIALLRVAGRGTVIKGVGMNHTVVELNEIFWVEVPIRELTK